jgi:mannose-6-phosphate isomerase-like protein (cupin superfamily)
VAGPVPQEVYPPEALLTPLHPGYREPVSTLIRPQLATNELDAGSDFVVAEWSAPPPAAGEREPMAPVHIHRGDDEAWYVLEGALGFSFDGVESTVSAGGAAIAKAGVAHTYWNAASATTRYLLIMTPRIRELIAVLHDPERRQGRSTEEVFAAYDSVLVPET